MDAKAHQYGWLVHPRAKPGIRRRSPQADGKSLVWDSRAAVRLARRPTNRLPERTRKLQPRWSGNQQRCRRWEKPRDLAGNAVSLASKAGASITWREPCAEGGPAAAA